MALVKCNECKKDVSFNAEKCPNCGNPINNDTVFAICANCSKEISVEEMNLYKGICEDCHKSEIKEIEEIKLEKPKISAGFITYIIIFIIFFIIITNQFSSLISEGDTFLILGGICVIFTFIVIPSYLVYKEYKDKYDEYIQYADNIEEYRKMIINRRKKLKIIQKQIEEDLIKCPNCHSKNVKEISSMNRIVSVGTLGLASSTIGKTYKCNDCNYKW